MFEPAETATAEVLSVLEQAASKDYFGEEVSQLEHAMQCAQLAVDAGVGEELVLAALLHDIGHCCAPSSAERMDELGVVDHEEIGGEFLRSRGFSEQLAQLVEGHVEAKRYLTFRNEEYRERLSEASWGTLQHQGGPMTAGEAAEFERDPLFHEKLRLRLWDDRGKEVGQQVAPLEHYREMLVRHLQQEAARASEQSQQHDAESGANGRR